MSDSVEWQRAHQQPQEQEQQHAEQDWDQRLAVLPMILQHIPLRERLCSCSLVSTVWPAAVLQTPAHMEVSTGLGGTLAVADKPSIWHKVGDWLQHHAGQVASIRLRHFGPPLMFVQLPCNKLSQLQHLSAEHMVVHMQSSSSDTRTANRCQPPAVSQLPIPNSGFSTAPYIQLSGSSGRRLSTPTVRVQDSQRFPAEQLQGPGLMPLPHSRPADAAQLMPPPSSRPVAVPFLPRLRVLELSKCHINLESFQQLSQVSSLTRLNLCGCRVLASQQSGFARASQHLKITQTVSAVLQKLTGLQALDIRELPGCSLLAVAAVSSMQYLQRMQLQLPMCEEEDINKVLAVLPPSLIAMTLLDLAIHPSPTVAAGLSRLSSLRELSLVSQQGCAHLDPTVLSHWSSLQHLTFENPCFIVDGTNVADLQQLLTALGRMTELQHLSLSGSQFQLLADPQQLSALTASSQLTSLALETFSGIRARSFGLQYILPQGRQLLQLQVLKLETADSDYTPEHLAVDEAGMQRIAECCSHLTELTLRHVRLEANLAPLVKDLKRTLVSFSLGGLAFECGAVAAVAQLSSLQQLEWDSPSALDMSGLQQLTALKGLTRLQLIGSSRLAQGMVADDAAGNFRDVVLTTAEGQPPDVYMQLHQLRSPPWYSTSLQERAPRASDEGGSNPAGMIDG